MSLIVKIFYISFKFDFDIEIFVTHLSNIQWAAVRTYFSCINDPPQKCTLL